MCRSGVVRSADQQRMDQAGHPVLAAGDTLDRGGQTFIPIKGVVADA